MKKGAVITLAVMLSLPLQPVLAYADTAVPAVTQPASGTTQPTTSPALTPAPVPTDGNTGSTALPPILDASGKPVNPGTLPDSPLYWLSNIIQKIQVFLTFDPVKKAALEENQALQKLAAARDMVEKGKPELAQKSMSEYSQKVQEAQKFLEQIKDPNSTTAQTLQKAMAQTDAQNLQVLSGLLDKLPAQAAEKLAGNIVRSMEKVVAKMTDEQKKQVQVQWQETAKHVNQGNLDAQTADALAKFQASLGLKGGDDSEGVRDKGKQVLQNGSMIENNEEDNTVLHNEDPNQPVHTIGDEKRAAAAEQEREREKKQEKDKNKEQEKNKVKQQDRQHEQQYEQDGEDEDNAGQAQVSPAIPAPTPSSAAVTQPATISPVIGQPQSTEVQSPAVYPPAGQERGNSNRVNSGKGKESKHDSEED